MLCRHCLSEESNNTRSSRPRTSESPTYRALPEITQPQSLRMHNSLYCCSLHNLLYTRQRRLVRETKLPSNAVTSSSPLQCRYRTSSPICIMLECFFGVVDDVLQLIPVVPHHIQRMDRRRATVGAVRIEHASNTPGRHQSPRTARPETAAETSEGNGYLSREGGALLTVLR